MPFSLYVTCPLPNRKTFTLQISSQSGELQLAPTATHSKKITSFALWMEAWNLYVFTIFSDIKFCNLAASYPILRWDVRHLDIWVECLSIPKS